MDDEGGSGESYQFCTKCLRHRDDCRPNDYHGAIPCDGGSWRNGL
jgi:hypothetical protein